LFHGDLQFDNIVYTAEGGFKLIDWREDFGGNTCNGDLYYDLAKLYGGMELNYLEMKKPTSYSTMITQSRCFITQYTDETLKSIQQNEFMDFLEKYQLNATKVKLLTAIILLNMAPLHINEFDVFLFFKAKLLFEDIHRKEKNNVWDFLHKND
jgi:thiamine kinase-like enzyme